MEKLTLEQLECVNGGYNSEDIPGALSRLFDAARPIYEQWEIQNPNATDEEKNIKAQQCLREAYQSMSESDKELIDAHAAEHQDFANILYQ